MDRNTQLRGAKRVNSNQRQHFSSSVKRQEWRKFYEDYLKAHPFRPDVFQRWVNHIRALLTDQMPEERNVLEQGFF